MLSSCLVSNVPVIKVNFVLELFGSWGNSTGKNDFLDVKT